MGVQKGVQMGPKGGLDWGFTFCSDPLQPHLAEGWLLSLHQQNKTKIIKKKPQLKHEPPSAFLVYWINKG